MKYLSSAVVLIVVIAFTGCFGPSSSNGGVELLGQMPQGYDMYMVLNPEGIGLEQILASLRENLPEDVLADLDEEDIPFDIFDWQEWKEGMALRDGAIGVFSLTEDDDFVAFFLPCENQTQLESFIQDNDFGETEFFTSGEYTVMVVAWDDDEQLTDLEDALNDGVIADQSDFEKMNEKISTTDASIAFFFSDKVAEVPIFGTFSANSDESRLEISVITDDEEVPQFLNFFGEGLISDNIRFTENTMSAVRFTVDIEALKAGYDEMSNIEEVEAGLPFIGFESMEEFLSIFEGDICVAFQKLELDDHDEPTEVEGMIALSLTDTEKLESSFQMISAIASAETEEFGDVLAYQVTQEDNDIWYFISDNVFYVSFNTRPSDIIDGTEAKDFFADGIAVEGFFGGAADPEGIMEGLEGKPEMQEIITALFEERIEFSVSAEDQMFTSVIVAGPDVLESAIALIPAAAAFADVPLPDEF